MKSTLGLAIAMAILPFAAPVAGVQPATQAPLQFGQTYLYDAHDPAVRHAADRDVSESFVFFQDGMGRLDLEGTSRFHWVAEDQGRGIVVKDYFDARNPDGDPLTIEEADLRPVRMRLSADGKRLVERTVSGSLNPLAMASTCCWRPTLHRAEEQGIHGHIFWEVPRHRGEQ